MFHHAVLQGGDHGHGGVERISQYEGANQVEQALPQSLDLGKSFLQMLEAKCNEVHFSRKGLASSSFLQDKL